MTKNEVEIKRILLHIEMTNLQARRDVEFGDGWRCDWQALLNEYDVELRQLIASTWPTEGKL